MGRFLWTWCAAGSLLTLTACSPPKPGDPIPPSEPRAQARGLPEIQEPIARAPRPDKSKAITLVEGLRLNRAERWVELDGFVPINVREKDRTGYTLIRYLECLAVTPMSGKDHEALMVTSVRPSTIHAALLTLGLEPGAPGGILVDGRVASATPARGAPVNITYRAADQPGPGNPIADYIVHADTGAAFDEEALGEAPQWVFAGSILENGKTYAADSEGLVIGLHTFGTEVVAFRKVMSPDSFIEEPHWIAHAQRTPEFGQGVTIRIAAQE